MILIIPDIHQDSYFLQAALDAHTLQNGDEVIFLGDLLDSRCEATKSEDALRSVFRQIEELRNRRGIQTTLLWGNHDWKYWGFRERFPKDPEIPSPIEIARLAEDDLSIRTLAVLMEEEDENFMPQKAPIRLFESAQLAAARHGWLITHAGVDHAYWPAKAADLHDGVERLNKAFRAQSPKPPHQVNVGLASVGKIRGGDATIGGPLWQDWDAEFTDNLPFPQLVGHTAGSAARRKGKSWCLDAEQGACALMHNDGRLEIIEIPLG